MSDDVIPDDLEGAREWLRARVDEGARCPCCTQFAKVYRRKINSGQASALIFLYAKCGTEFAHLPSVDRRFAGNGGDISKLRYWDLAEEHPDSGGRWRVTELGEQFIRGTHRVPKYARIYDSRLLDLAGEPVSIREALGTRFNYDELMAGV